jgi:hypothetical protein
MRGRKLRNCVNWQGVLEQYGVKQGVDVFRVFPVSTTLPILHTGLYIDGTRIRRTAAEVWERNRTVLLWVREIVDTFTGVVSGCVLSPSARNSV